MLIFFLLICVPSWYLYSYVFSSELVVTNIFYHLVAAAKKWINLLEVETPITLAVKLSECIQTNRSCEVGFLLYFWEEKFRYVVLYWLRMPLSLWLWRLVLVLPYLISFHVACMMKNTLRFLQMGFSCFDGFIWSFTVELWSLSILLLFFWARQTLGCITVELGTQYA